MQTEEKVWDWRAYILKYAPENSTYRHLLLTLSCFMDSAGGSCFPSVKKLVKCTSLSKPTVLKYLAKAKQDGWIKIDKIGLKGQKWRRQQYTASMPENVVKEVNHVNKVGKTDNKGGKTDTGKVVKEVNQYNNSPYTSSSNSPERVATDVASVPDKQTWKKATAVAEHLKDSICDYDPTHKYNKNPPSLNSWIVELDRAIRLDGRTADQLELLIDYIFTRSDRVAEFWKPNIQSGKKLRQHFDTIKQQIKRQHTNGKPDKLKQQLQAFE